MAAQDQNHLDPLIPEQIEHIRSRTGWDYKIAEQYVHMRQQVIGYLNSIPQIGPEALTVPLAARNAEMILDKELFKLPGDQAKKYFPVTFSNMIDAGVDNIAGWSGISRIQVIGTASILVQTNPPEFYIAGLTPDNYHDPKSRDEPISITHSLGVFSVAAGIDGERIGDVQKEMEAYLAVQKKKELCGVSVDKIREKMEANSDMTVRDFIFKIVRDVEDNCMVQSAAKPPVPEKSKFIR